MQSRKQQNSQARRQERLNRILELMSPCVQARMPNVFIFSENSLTLEYLNNRKHSSKYSNGVVSTQKGSALSREGCD